MAETININGKEYIEKGAAAAYQDSEHVAVVVDRGWIFEGYRQEGEGFQLASAHVVRKWTNGLGIGGLVKAEHKDDYTLDMLGNVSINPNAVIAVIPLEW